MGPLYLRANFVFGRFPGGVTHSFTDSAEDRDRLLSFEKMFIGHLPHLAKNLHLMQHDNYKLNLLKTPPLVAKQVSPIYIVSPLCDSVLCLKFHLDA